MGKGILVVLVVLLFIAGMGAISYSLFSTVSILPRLSNSTANMGELHGSHLAELRDIYYHVPYEPNGTEPCESLEEKKIIIMEVSYNPNQITDFCEVWVDSHMEKRVRMYSEGCGVDCDDVVLAIDVPAQEFRKEHHIEFCCQGMCRKKIIEPLCEISAQ